MKLITAILAIILLFAATPAEAQNDDPFQALASRLNLTSTADSTS